jgi:regulator of sigma D
MSENCKPDFSTGSLELQVVDDVVCIYGNREGLAELIALCQRLIDKPSIGHFHLEDRDLLTEKSLIGAIAIFEDEDGAHS